MSPVSSSTGELWRRQENIGGCTKPSLIDIIYKVFFIEFETIRDVIREAMGFLVGVYLLFHQNDLYMNTRWSFPGHRLYQD